MHSNDLRNLFHKPQIKPIGGVDFQLYKIAFDQFGDAMALGEWLGEGKFSIDKIREAVKFDSEQRRLLLTVIGGCLKLGPTPSASATAVGLTTDFLTPDEVAEMPIAMLAEAVLVIMEENTDFFIQTLPSLTKTMVRLGSIGSELLNSSSALATGLNASPATALPK